MTGYNVLLPDSSRSMLPELALPAMDALQRLGSTPVTLDMAAMAELYRDLRYKRHGGYELFLFYARDVVAKGNIDFALSFGLSGILDDPTKGEMHYLPEEFKLPGLIYFHSRGADAVSQLVQAGAAEWGSTTICCSSQAYVDALRAQGVTRVAHVPLPYSPRVFFPQHAAPANPAYPLQLDDERLASGYAVSFAGTCTPYRTELLAPLAAAGVELAIFGDPGWMLTSLSSCFRGAVRRLEDLNTVFNASRINLDLPAAAEPEGDYVSARIVEGLGSGGFFITLDQPGLGTYAQAGTEVALCEDAGDLTACVERWLANPDGRSAVAAAGHARVAGEAQWTQRLKPALAQLELGLLTAAR